MLLHRKRGHNFIESNNFCIFAVGLSKSLPNSYRKVSVQLFLSLDSGM